MFKLGYKGLTVLLFSSDIHNYEPDDGPSESTAIKKRNTTSENSQGLANFFAVEKRGQRLHTSGALHKPFSQHETVESQIKAAEKLGGCILDFQI